MLNNFENNITEAVTNMLPAAANGETNEQVRAHHNYPLTKREDVLSEAKAAVSYLQDLKSVYAEFEALEKKANTVLYEFLGGVFLVVQRIKLVGEKTTKAEKQRLRETFELIMDERKENKEVNFTKATSLETKALRFVCGNITQSREKAWARVLKIAQKNKDVMSRNVSFAAWLASEGGVYEVANTNKNGVKPSDREQGHINCGLTVLDGWLGTEEHSEIVDAANGEAKAENEMLEGLTITLNFRPDGATPQKVIELRDDVAIERVLLLLGRKMSTPLRSREEVLAEETAKMQAFTDITGHEVESHRM